MASDDPAQRELLKRMLEVLLQIRDLIAKIERQIPADLGRCE